jgi:hypothetical protein
MANPGVFLSPRFRAGLKNLSAGDIERVEGALRGVQECFGRPHVHSGISIRRLRKNVYECRAGLSLWLLFRVKQGSLEFFLAGDHDAVRAWLRNY